MREIRGFFIKKFFFRIKGKKKEKKRKKKKKLNLIIAEHVTMRFQISFMFLLEEIKKSIKSQFPSQYITFSIFV